MTQPNPNLKPFAERLRILRQRIGLTQKALGRKVGAGQTTVGQWEEGKTSPTVAVLIALCNLFDVAADYLIGRSDHEHGLAPDQWIVDEAEVERLRADPKARRERVRYASKVPRRARILDHDQIDRLKKELEKEK